MIYTMNYKSGTLEPVTRDGLLPAGAVVSYGDMANPRKRFVVLSAQIVGPGQPCLSETGHQSHVTRSDINGPGGWEDEGETLTDDEIEAFELEAAAAKHELATEAAHEREAKAVRQDEEKARYLKQYPFLTRLDGQSSCSLGAKNLRALLKKEFPGVKFRVRSKSYAGGNSINVSWTDGPTVDQVEPLANLFTEAGFDGMQDLKYYLDSVFPKLFGGSDYVFCNRHHSAATLRKAIEQVRAMNYADLDGVDWDDVKINDGGWVEAPNVQVCGRWLQSMIHREAAAIEA